MSPPVQSITSRDNPLLQRIRRLMSKPSAYRQSGEVWIEGDHLVRAWLDGVMAGGVDRGEEFARAQAVIAEPAWQGRPDLRGLAMQAGRVAVLPATLMAQLSGLESPAPLGFLVPLPPSSFAAPGEVGRPLSSPDLPPLAADGLVLDRLQDPGNVGSILRSAAALGVRQVVALSGTVALWSPKVLRAGMGAHFQLALVEGLEPQALIDAGWPLVVTSSHEAIDLHRAGLPQPCAWVMGHEGQGVHPALMQAARLRVRIPQPGGQESLNVAAAAAICLYEGARRRFST